jgi:hypothetical protein
MGLDLQDRLRPGGLPRRVAVHDGNSGYQGHYAGQVGNELPNISRAVDVGRQVSSRARNQLWELLCANGDFSFCKARKHPTRSQPHNFSPFDDLLRHYGSSYA